MKKMIASKDHISSSIGLEALQLYNGSGPNPNDKAPDIIQKLQECLEKSN